MLSFCLNGFNASPYVDGSGDLAAQIEGAARAGFAAFGPDRFSLDHWQAKGDSLAALGQRMRDSGVACGFIGAVAMAGLEPDLDGAIEAGLRAADALGASFLQINMAIEAPEERLATAERICARLRPHGLRLAIEYLPTTRLATLGDTLAIVDHVGADAAGAVIDIWHHVRGPDAWEVLDTVPLAAIAYLELDDALPALGDDQMSEMLHRRAFPGEGEFDVARFAALFRRRGYDGMVSIEVLNAELRALPPDAFAHRALESAAPYWR